MSYKVKEIFLTIQGEGFNSGHAAVFCRFTGCNLWTGHEKDRSKAVCDFCDTDFVGTDGHEGGNYATAEDLVKKIGSLWHDKDSLPFVVFTGGEPALQIDKELLSVLKRHNIRSAIETNGTVNLEAGINWVCVSPKKGANLLVTKVNELKLVFPQTGMDPASFLGMEFDHFMLQPMDGQDLARNTELAVKYVKEHPQWKLSLQTHKYIKIP